MPLHFLREPAGPSFILPHEQLPPPMDHGRGLMPSQYSHAMARLILARLEMGDALHRIVADPGMPSYATVHHWRRRHPEFDDAWQEVRRDLAAARRQALVGREDRRAAREAALARAKGRKPRRKAGRRSTYTREVAEAYCELIAAGLTGRAAARRPGMPSPPMVYRWLRNHPEFRALYVGALRFREDMLCDQMLMLAKRAGPGNMRLIRREMNWLQQRIAACHPKVWIEAD
jgi:hypothetical protein